MQCAKCQHKCEIIFKGSNVNGTHELLMWNRTKTNMEPWEGGGAGEKKVESMSNLFLCMMLNQVLEIDLDYFL